MKVIRHGKPSKEYTATLRKPTESDYARLLKACLTALIQGEKDVIIAFAYTLKFPEDFPRGIRIEKVDAKNVHRVKALKLLAWLNKHGHTDITMEKLTGQIVSFGKLAAKLDRELFWIDEDEDLENG